MTRTPHTFTIPSGLLTTTDLCDGAKVSLTHCRTVLTQSGIKPKLRYKRTLYYDPGALPLLIQAVTESRQQRARERLQYISLREIGDRCGISHERARQYAEDGRLKRTGNRIQRTDGERFISWYCARVSAPFKATQLDAAPPRSIIT